jgi:DNA-binding SARP family transcriptional activator
MWAESREEWPVAVSYALQMVQIDPLAELAQQRLMGLYLRQGEVGLALRQYRQLEHQLRQELGISPSPETRALHEDILRQQRSPTTPMVVLVSLSTRQSTNMPLSDATIIQNYQPSVTM